MDIPCLIATPVAWPVDDFNLVLLLFGVHVHHSLEYGGLDEVLMRISIARRHQLKILGHRARKGLFC